MADTNNVVVERKEIDVEADNSATEELKSNSESDRQKSEWISTIRSGLMAGAGQNAVGDVSIKKLPASLRKPVECYTPRRFQFGLHNRDPQASGSESEVLKIRLAAACKLNPGEWEKFCADVVDNPQDMMLRSYGIYSSVNELNPKEVQYLLTLDALTLVLVLSSLSRVPESMLEKAGQFPYPVRGWLRVPNFFIRSLVEGGFEIEDLLKYGVEHFAVFDDLFLCENQIPMALMKKVISKCYGLLPQKSMDLYFLRDLENPDSDLAKWLLDMILKIVACITCSLFFAEPCPGRKKFLLESINEKYEVGELENCAHVFACIHKVMTTCVESTTADKKSHATDTEVSASGVNQQPESDIEALATVRTPPSWVATAVAKTFGCAKQLFLLAVATSSKQLASVFATIFRFSRETATEKRYSFFHVIQSATVLKKAGLKIQGIPGMVQQVAFENGCLFLPIMSQSENIESYIRNMAAYEYWNTSGPFPFIDYLLLMSQLIRTPEDVSYLVDCDVILAYHGTHQLIFQMWERLQSTVVYPAYSDEYREKIVKPINSYRASGLKLIAIEFYSRYCSKPWLVISLISAIIFLVAILIQTYVLVIGSDKMQPHFPRGG